MDWFEFLTSLGDHFENFVSGGVLSKGMPRRNIVERNETLGKKRKRFSSFLQNLSGASSLCVRDEVFWTEDLIEETPRKS